MEITYILAYINNFHQIFKFYTHTHTHGWIDKEWLSNAHTIVTKIENGQKKLGFLKI